MNEALAFLWVVSDSRSLFYGLDMVGNEEL